MACACTHTHQTRGLAPRVALASRCRSRTGDTPTTIAIHARPSKGLKTFSYSPNPSTLFECRLTTAHGYELAATRMRLSALELLEVTLEAKSCCCSDKVGSFDLSDENLRREGVIGCKSSCVRDIRDATLSGVAGRRSSNAPDRTAVATPRTQRTSDVPKLLGRCCGRINSSSCSMRARCSRICCSCCRGDAQWLGSTPKLIRRKMTHNSMRVPRGPLRQRTR